MLSALVLWTESGWADPSATDRVAARALFEQARELMAAGNATEACPKFADSLRLDPAGGTMLNLALCREKEGRTASAWSQFNDALARARVDGRTDREMIAQEHIVALLPKLSRVTVRLAQGADVQGLMIQFDDTTMTRAAIGVSMPADPGPHHIRATAPGKLPWATTVSVRGEAGNQEVMIPVLQDNSTTPEHSPAVVTTEKAPARRTVGYVAAGAGILAVGVGSYFGLRASSKWDASKRLCPDGLCHGDGVPLHDEAVTSAQIANVAFAVGLIGIGIGAYTLLTSNHASSITVAPKSAQILPTVGPSAAGVSVGAVW